MTKQEIQALIDAKIAGQGSAVDTGGALPAILSAIIGLIPDSPTGAKTAVIPIDGLITDGGGSFTIDAFKEAHAIVDEDWAALLDPNIEFKAIKSDGTMLQVVLFDNYSGGDAYTIVAGGVCPEALGTCVANS